MMLRHIVILNLVLLLASRNNILNGFWTFQGIGVGISSDNKVYITEDFN